MPLDAPKLDSRTFDDLVAEARQRIPRYTPEWTNLNDSDPGMTLVRLNAWLTETILYELNRVPELNYIKFLDLLQIKRRPARAATTELLFTLKKLNGNRDPLTVLVPRGAKVAVDDTDLAQEVLFETDYTLVAVNAALGAAIVPRAGDPTLELLTEYDDKSVRTTWLHSFHPFGAAPTANASMLLGFALRPFLKGKLQDFSQDVWPAGQLDLYVDAAQAFDTDDAGLIIDTSTSRRCLFPQETTAAADNVEWQVYTGTDPASEITADGAADTGWRRLNVASDETAGLTRSGHVRLEIPERINSARIDDLSRDFWERLGLRRPPETLAELLDDLRDGLPELKDALTEDQWATMGLTDAGALNTVLNNCADGIGVADAVEALDATLRDAIDPASLSAAEWVALDVGYDAPAAPTHDGESRRLHWLRAVLSSVNAEAPPALLTEIRLNTVPATAAATRVAERLGSSDGRPAQSFELANRPVYFDPDSGVADLELQIIDGVDAQPQIWRRVDDFFRARPDDPWFLLDETTGVITFGDGKRGRIPVAGATISASRYRSGGGAIGNVGAESITKLKGALRNVDSVTNPRPAGDGSDAETLDEVILRAPHTLRVRDRAVSQADFAFLAQATPGAAVHKAYAVANRAYDPSASPKLVPRAGAVTVIVLPANDQPTPLPSEAQLRAVCAYLEPRRLITTELHVAGPDYARLGHLRGTLRIARDADIKTVSDAASAALLAWLHPLTGGADGTGWPFGEDIYYADIYERLLAISGVRRVAELTLGLDSGADTDPATDVLAIPEGNLPYLPSEIIDLKVIYDAFA